MNRKQLQELLVFSKAQVSAFCGGIIDYLTMIFLTEFLGIHYIFSIGMGGIVGAIVNFSINRKWTFKSGQKSIGNQLVKFSIVAAGSILFKSIGTYILTEWLLIDYKISRIIADAIVCFGFNYYMQKKWVFAT